MEKLYGWTLVVMLSTAENGVDLGPQPECRDAAKAWMVEARAWEARSGVESGSLWICVPPWVVTEERIQMVSR